MKDALIYKVCKQDRAKMMGQESDVRLKFARERLPVIACLKAARIRPGVSKPSVWLLQPKSSYKRGCHPPDLDQINGHSGHSSVRYEERESSTLAAIQLILYWTEWQREDQGTHKPCMAPAWPACSMRTACKESRQENMTKNRNTSLSTC